MIFKKSTVAVIEMMLSKIFKINLFREESGCRFKMAAIIKFQSVIDEPYFFKDRGETKNASDPCTEIEHLILSL